MLNNKKLIETKNGIIAVTPETVVLLDTGIYSERDAVQAFRLVHRNSSKITNKPYVVLCGSCSLDEVTAEIDALVETGVFSEEFVAGDVLVTQITYCGKSPDRRIQWFMI